MKAEAGGIWRQRSKCKVRNSQRHEMLTEGVVSQHECGM
jgi:hypothetical protein